VTRSRLRCHGHNSLLLSSYLCGIKWKENYSCSACDYQLQDLTHLLLVCSTTEPLRHAIFGNTSSIFDLFFRPWSVARLLSLHGVLPRSYPRKVRVILPHPRLMMKLIVLMFGLFDFVIVVYEQKPNQIL